MKTAAAGSRAPPPHVPGCARPPARSKLIVALADTNNIVAVDQLRAHLQGDLEIELRLAGDSEIERAIEHYYGHEFSIDGILHEIETGEVDYQRRSPSGDEYSPAGGAPDLGAARRRGRAQRLRHPLRAGAELPAHPLPHRRRAAPDPLAAQDLLAGDGGAPQGDGEDEHRRDARAAGRAHLG